MVLFSVQLEDGEHHPNSPIIGQPSKCRFGETMPWWWSPMVNKPRSLESSRAQSRYRTFSSPESMISERVGGQINLHHHHHSDYHHKSSVMTKTNRSSYSFWSSLFSRCSSSLFLLFLSSLLLNYSLLITVVSFFPTVACWSHQVEATSSSLPSSSSDQPIELIYSVSEGVPIGTFIGLIKSINVSVVVEPPFLIVPIPGGDILQKPAIVLGQHDTQSDSRTLLDQRINYPDSTTSTVGSVDTDLNIDQSTGEIRTAIELDREQRTHYQFIAISLTGINVHVRINIEDVNDNAPKFPTDEVELEFPENSKPRDVKRALPPAIDLDRGMFGTQQYRIVSGNIGNAFRLISHREKDDVLYLDLQVNGVLDRESVSGYNLVVEALDGGQPALKDQLTIKITILDHNDCEPVFTQNHYYGTVAENVTLGTPLLKITAIDNDQDENGQVIYMLHSKQTASSSLTTSSASNFFSINRQTGWIQVNKPLDFESQEFHELVVIARDQGAQPLETSAFVSIRVTDVNDNQPTVNLLFLTANSKPAISEDAKIGDLVARISVKDADDQSQSELFPSPGKTSTASKRYSPYNGLSITLLGARNGEFGLRSADQIVHLIVVTGRLDRERRSKYQLTILVSDKGHPPLNTTMTFELEVLDVNDNEPFFDKPIYHVTLPEATDIGSSVFQVSANDRDSDSILTYAFLMPTTTTDNSVQQSSTANIDDESIAYFDVFNRQNRTHRMATKTDWFSIDRRTGLITTRTQVDCETDAQPTLTVIVTDSVLMLSTTTTTSNNNNNNQLTNDDQDKKPTDIGGFIATTVVAISISDINDNEPIFDQTFYNVTVSEAEPIGHCLLTVLATDSDCGVNAMVNYSLGYHSSSTPSSYQPIRLTTNQPIIQSLANDRSLNKTSSLSSPEQMFRLDSRTGQLCIAQELDFETTAVYDMPVLAVDRGGLFTIAMIKIQVIDANDNPPVFYPKEYKVSVREMTRYDDYQQRVSLITVMATDQDSPNSPFGLIEYEIKTGNEKLLFEIDSRTGEIFLLKPFLVGDGGRSGSSGSQYQLTVSARDGGGLESKEPAQVSISVISLGDDSLASSSRFLAPSFVQRQFNFQIIENVAQGAIVGTVKAKIDQNENNHQINYAIYSGDPEGYFTIDSHQGTISVKSSSIDRERHSYLLLNVQASTIPVDSKQWQRSGDSVDHHGWSSSIIRSAHTQVNVTILDENDNVPTFPNQLMKISIPENVPLDNSTLFVARAIDHDAEQFGEIRYSLYPATPTNHHNNHQNLENREHFPFSIDERTGHVWLRHRLDFESRSEYQLRVVAIDGGQLSSEMVILVYVQDVNDNCPIFVGTIQSIEIDHDNDGQRESYPLFRIQVPENVPINTNFYQIKATDADTGSNSRLTYSMKPLLAGKRNEDFKSIPIDIFPNTGAIYVKDGLDRESVDRYEMMVLVSDHGLPNPLNATAIIHINIQDVNDNRPYWSQPVYQFEVAEDAPPGTLIGQVVAFDVDLDGNSSLVYNFTEETADHSCFRINPTTGHIYLQQNLDREMRSRYELKALVHDQGIPKPLFSEEKVTILVDVLDINDNRPIFEQDDNNKLIVPVGLKKKSLVATFKAIDLDAGPNGTVYYSMVEENDLFVIDSQSGSLMAKIDIKESLKRSTHKLSLVAIDGQGKKSKTKPVTIEIVDKQTFDIDLEQIEQYEFVVRRADFQYGYRIGSIDLPVKLVHHHQCNNRFFTNFNYQIKQSLPFFIETDESLEQRIHLVVFDRLNVFHESNQIPLLLCIDWSQCLATMLDADEIKSHHHQLVQCDFGVKVQIQLEGSEEKCQPLPLNDNRDLYDIKITYNPNQQSMRSKKPINDLLYLNHSVGCHSEPIGYQISSPMIDDNTLSRMFSLADNSVFQWNRPNDHALMSRYLHEDFVVSLIAKHDDSHRQSVPIRVKILSSDTRIGNIMFTNEKFLELEEDCCRIGSPIIQARINISHDDFRIRYYLTSGGEHRLMTSDEQFTLNSETGLLYLKREFDFERKHEHRLNITAVVYDQKTPILTFSNIVKIRILNTNDEPPVFVKRSYEKEILENAPVGQLLVQVEAKDSDHSSVQSSNLTYVMPESYQFAQYFQLNSKNGEIKLVKNLDREMMEHYYVPVYGFDDDFKHHAFTLVHIKVLDINDNPPYFVQKSFDLQIPESVKPGTMIYHLVALDPDLSGQTCGENTLGLQYRIVSGNVGNKFVLQEQRGELSTNAPLDREIQSVYHLEVEVSDLFYQSTCNVTIELLDTNDNAPIFDKSDYYAILNDGSFGWLNVVTVRAIDSDGDKLLYSIVADFKTNLTRYFNMDSERGEISLHSSLLFPMFEQLNANVFTFEVNAIEAGRLAYQSHKSKAKVHLTLVTNQNQYHGNLRLLKYPYVMVVDEPIHSILIDQRIGLLEHYNGFGGQSDKIYSKSTPYSFRVLNPGNPQQSFNEYFSIQQHNGAIVVKKPLQHPYYEALVEVKQNFDTRQTTVNLIQIFIGGIDDRRFVHSIQLDSISVSENQSPGSEIVDLGSYTNRRHHQEHTSPKYSYWIFYSDVDPTAFDIDHDGVMRTRKPLDYESQPSQINVLVFAFNTQQSTGQRDQSLYENSFLFNLTLTLTNLDDNQARFTQKHYIGTIREGDATGTQVAQVNAIDIDEIGPWSSSENNGSREWNRFSYYIVDGNVDNAFTINSDGVIQSNIVLDREIRERYYLKIIASEIKSQPQKQSDGDPSSWPFMMADEADFQHLTQCICEVIVIDQNDNVPVFPPCKEISISEDIEVGAVVATWTANDVDIHPTLTYTKRSLPNNNNRDDDYFDIGLYNGKIYSKVPLRQLLGSQSLVRSVRFQLVASDQDHSVETEINLNIKRNYSKMVPVFKDGGHFYQKLNLDQDYAVLLQEINIEIFRLPMVVDDQTTKRKILFELNRQAGVEGFYIDQNLGIIYNNRTIRYRADRLVTMAITARYTDSDLSTQATLLLSLDRDSASNQIGPNYYYYSSTATGLTTSNNLNNPNNNHNLNKKDSAPSSAMSMNSFSLEIESSQIGVPLLRLPKRSRSNYVIVSGNTNKNFMMMRGNELVLVNRPLTDQYLLKIKSMPANLDRMLRGSNSTTAFVHIKIRPSNNQDSAAFASPFKSQIFEIEINELEKVGTEIQSLKFTSKQHGDEDGFHFRIFSGNEQDSFRVDGRSGTLIINQRLDYETVSAYRLGVVAESHHSGSKYFSIVNVQLVNANEYCPQFPTNHFKVLIDENAALGSRVIPIRAIDQDQNPLNYTVMKLSEWSEIPLFRYDIESGYLVLDSLLDYESIRQHNNNHQMSSTVYKFIVRATDLKGSNNNLLLYSGGGGGSNGPTVEGVHCNSVESILEVQIGSVDEFSPQFLNDSYDFKLTATISKSRIKVGQVLATDSDSGPDGLVVYSIKTISPPTILDLVHINSSSGLISMTTYSANLPRQFSIIVLASSGRVNSLSSLAVVNVRLTLIELDENLNELDLAEVINSIDQSQSAISAGSREATTGGAIMPGWIIFLIVLLLLVTFVMIVSIIMIRMHQQQQQQQQQQNFMTGHLRTLTGHNVGLMFRKIGPYNNDPSVNANNPNVSPAYSVAHYGTTNSGGGGVVMVAPPCYNDVTMTSAQINCLAPTNHQEGLSASSGRGSAEDDADLDDVDEEIRMINESSNYYTEAPCEGITTTSEYLARLGVSNHYEEEPDQTSSLAFDDKDDESIYGDVVKQPVHAAAFKPYETMKKSFGPQIQANQKVPSTSSVNPKSNRRIDDELVEWKSQPAQKHQSMEPVEELSGSYNWDYLQQWGPPTKYQPKYQVLSSVFAEIARLKSADGIDLVADDHRLESEMDNFPGHQQPNIPTTKPLEQSTELMNATRSQRSSSISSSSLSSVATTTRLSSQRPPSPSSAVNKPYRSSDVHLLNPYQVYQQQKQHPPSSVMNDDVNMTSSSSSNIYRMMFDENHREQPSVNYDLYHHHQQQQQQQQQTPPSTSSSLVFNNFHHHHRRI